ncbi:MAG TPA: heavy metal-associated domain-containing protein [Bacteroidales bacterium]|nr:heavy metal-associated domain-containing protein [Bacteroidales bacterium]
MKNILLIIAFCISVSIYAQKAATVEIKIKTSAQCDMCKERIEKAMAFEKGVKSSVLDLDSKVLTVNYLPKKTTPEKIRNAVAATGYDADDVPANAKAYDALPPCCKKPDDPDHIGH